MWDLVLVSKISFQSCHLSADKWVPQIRFAVNWLQIYGLSKLQSTCGKVIDFGSENRKVVPFGKFYPNYRSFILTTHIPWTRLAHGVGAYRAARAQVHSRESGTQVVPLRLGHAHAVFRPFMKSHTAFCVGTVLPAELEGWCGSRCYGTHHNTHLLFPFSSSNPKKNIKKRNGASSKVQWYESYRPNPAPTPPVL
jgi:hypothetical protein